MAKRHQRDLFIDHQSHGLKADHGKEQADTGGDASAKRGRDGPDQPGAKPRQREQQEQHGCDEHGCERLLPAETLPKNDYKSEVGVKAHARGDSNRPSGPQPHDRRAKRGRKDGCHKSCFKRNACFCQDAGVHYDDVGHCQECACAGKNLAAKGGPGIGKSEKPVHV